MRIIRLFAALAISSGIWLAISVASSDCWAVLVYFDGSTSSDFLDATNWTPENAPGTNQVDLYGIDDGLSSTLAAGNVSIAGLRVGSADKTHSFGDNHFGRLTMTGGSLSVIGSNTLSVGRENQSYYPVAGDYNKNTIVDAADYVVWRKGLDTTYTQSDYDYWRVHFGNNVRGGEIIMTGSSTLTTNGALIGERTRGLLSVGPNATVDVKTYDSINMVFGGTEDLRIGGYGPAYDDFGAEPGLDGNGLVDVEGTLNAKDAYVSEHGSRGELRLTGSGTVNLNGALHMDFCGGCVTDPALLALRSAKVSIVGSGGTFNVGLDPDPMTVDPMPPPRDLLAASPTATFSFTADAGGVTPIVIAQNTLPEPSGTAYIDGAQLELNLDAYTSTTPLTLISAPPLQLIGTFGAVTFLGHRTAMVNYDVASGTVFLNNFHMSSGAGQGITSFSVPEPSSQMLMALALGLLSLWSANGRDSRQSVTGATSG